MRPLGGIIMGYIGDNFGRKFALELSITLMIVPGFFMGCLPTFDDIGYFATILLILLRMLQGLAVGGEMIGAYIFTIEACEPTQRGLWGGVCKSTALCGTVLGMGFVTILREVLTDNEMNTWGWRIPFLSSVILGVIGLYLRKNLHESEEFMKVKNRGLTTVQNNSSHGSTHGSNHSTSSLTLNNAHSSSSNNINSDSHNNTDNITTQPGPTSAVQQIYYVIIHHWPEIILVMFIAAYWSASYYACFIWMVYYTSNLMPSGGLEHHPWVVNITMLTVLVILLPFGGFLGDIMAHKWKSNLLGYRRAMALGCLITIIFGVPAFYLINLHEVWSVCLGQGIFALSLCIYGSIMAVVMVHQFETQYRYLAMGIAYNLASAIFGGPAPLIQTGLAMKVKNEGDDQIEAAILPAVYIILIAILSCFALLCGPYFIELIRGVGYASPSKEGDSNSISSNSSSGKSIDESSSQHTKLDTSSSPLVTSCFEVSNRV